MVVKFAILGPIKVRLLSGDTVTSDYRMYKSVDRVRETLPQCGRKRLTVTTPEMKR